MSDCEVLPLSISQIPLHFGGGGFLLDKDTKACYTKST